MLHLIVCRMRRAVGAYNAVDEESSVIGLVAEVAAVGPELVGLQGQIGGETQGATVDRLGQPLIRPIPNGSSKNAGISVDNIPVFLHIASGVTH